jgi:hypothetical protein
MADNEHGDELNPRDAFISLLTGEQTWLFSYITSLLGDVNGRTPRRPAALSRHALRRHARSLAAALRPRPLDR